MKRLRVLVAIALGGCVPNMSVESGGTVQAPLSEKPYSISCDEGHRFAARALRAREYKVTEVNRSTAGGAIVGVKNGQTSTITVTCAADGVRVKATGGGTWVEQGLQFSFHQVVDRGDKIWPPPKSPRVMVEWIDGPESKLWFPQEIGSAGLTAVRVQVINGGQRALKLDPRRIVARGAGGGVAPIPEADAKRRVGAIDPGLDAKLLKASQLGPGKSVVGFVFFPAGSYTGANVQLIDVPTGEADGYDVSFAPQT
jgi:hypothetical protein